MSIYATLAVSGEEENRNVYVNDNKIKNPKAN